MIISHSNSCLIRPHEIIRSNKKNHRYIILKPFVKFLDQQLETLIRSQKKKK